MLGQNLMLKILCDEPNRENGYRVVEKEKELFIKRNEKPFKLTRMIKKTFMSIHGASATIIAR